MMAEIYRRIVIEDNHLTCDLMATPDRICDFTRSLNISPYRIDWYILVLKNKISDFGILKLFKHI